MYIKVLVTEMIFYRNEYIFTKGKTKLLWATKKKWNYFTSLMENRSLAIIFILRTSQLSYSNYLPYLSKTSVQDNLNCIIKDLNLPFSGVICPLRIKKSIRTGALVVLNWGESALWIHSSAVNNSKFSTSPSAFCGIKSRGNLRSYTYSVFGNKPLSLSK